MPYTPYQPTWNNQYLNQNPYQPMMPSQTVQPYQQPVNGVIKVNGRDSAMQYQLPPNSTSPALFDQNGRVFYIVSTDGTGMKTVEAFDFSEHVEQPQQVQIDGTAYVSRSEFDEFTAKVNDALEALNGVHAAVPAAQPAAEFEQPNGAAQAAPSGGRGRSRGKSSAV